jgi:hypothetical protein
VYRLSLKSVLRHNFAALQSDAGTFTALAATVDPAIAQQLSALLS